MTVFHNKSGTFWSQDSVFYFSEKTGFDKDAAISDARLGKKLGVVTITGSEITCAKIWHDGSGTVVINGKGLTAIYAEGVSPALLPTVQAELAACGVDKVEERQTNFLLRAPKSIFFSALLLILSPLIANSMANGDDFGDGGRRRAKAEALKGLLESLGPTGTLVVGVLAGLGFAAYAFVTIKKNKGDYLLIEPSA